MPGPDVRDVRDPGAVGSIHIELALQSIRCDDRWHADSVSRRLIATDRSDSVSSHDASHSLSADLFPRFTKVQEYAGAAVDSAAGHVRLTDQLEQPLVFDRTIRKRLVDPGIEATPSDLQDPAHPPDREPIPLRMNEGVLYSDSLAKYAAAFFRMSRSS